MKKNLQVLACVLLALTVMAGCSKKTEGGGAASAGGAKTLSIMWWGADQRHIATEKVLELYTQKTGVAFTHEYMAWDGYWTKLPALVASNSVTDVLQMDGAYISDYVSRGVLADLSDMALSDTVPQKVLDNIKIDGKIYGVPLSHNAQGLAYNKKALADYGITEPKPGWTYDEFWAFARECREKLPKDKWGIAYQGGTWDNYQYYQTSFGKGPIFPPGGKDYNIDKTLWMEFYNLQEQLRKANVVPSAEVQLGFREYDPQADAMASGKVMTRGATTGSTSALENLMPGEVGVVSMPTGPAGGGWAQSTLFLSAFAKSPNIAEAKAFMKWFISDLEAGNILGMTRGMPISEAVYNAVEPTLTNGEKLNKSMLDVCLPYALPFYVMAPGWQDFTAGYEAEVQNLMSGNQTVEKTYENIIKLADQVKARVNR
ncbi:sugar ABC transporter substrate-binding protein [Spirochaetia bacterium]|nr:sugar ABC transporter substrate-binding protein [Spirochaetia bacterium]